jgi:hypothetical protein
MKFGRTFGGKTANDRANTDRLIQSIRDKATNEGGNSPIIAPLSHRSEFIREGHSLTVGKCVRPNATTWVVCDGSPGLATQATGIVNAVVGDWFEVTFGGMVRRLSFGSGAIGDLYYVQADGSLGITPTDQAILRRTSDTEGIIIPASAASTAATESVSQASHGFTVGQPVRYAGGSWVGAKDDDDDDLIAFIHEVSDANNFKITWEGPAPLTGAAKGLAYYLTGSAGVLTPTRPTPDFGTRVRAIAIGIDTDLVYVLPTFFVTGHEHQVEDGAIPIVKLGHGDAPGVLGYRLYASDQEIELISPPVPGTIMFLSGGNTGAGDGLEWVELDTSYFGPSGVTAGTYGSGSSVPSFTVDAAGFITAASVFNPVLAGDVTGTTAASVVTKIQGFAVDSATPVDQDVMTYSSAGGKWTPAQLLDTVGQLLTFGDPGGAFGSDKSYQLDPGSDGSVLISHGAGSELEWGRDLIGDFTLDGSLTLAESEAIMWGGTNTYIYGGDTSGGYIYIGCDGALLVGYNANVLAIEGGPPSEAATINFGGSGTVMTYNFASNAGGLFTIYGNLKVSGYFGVFGTTPVGKTTVADLAALVTTETAGASYTTTTQDMLNHIKTDLSSIRNKLNAFLGATRSYGLN